MFCIVKLFDSEILISILQAVQLCTTKIDVVNFNVSNGCGIIKMTNKKYFVVDIKSFLLFRSNSYYKTENFVGPIVSVSEGYHFTRRQGIDCLDFSITWTRNRLLGFFRLHCCFYFDFLDQKFSNPLYNIKNSQIVDNFFFLTI